MQTLCIRPVAGRVVRDPDLHDLITAARSVPDSPFWRRRLRDGDVALDASPPSVSDTATPARDVSARTTPARRTTTADAANDTGAKP